MNITPKKQFIDSTRELMNASNEKQEVVISGVAITTGPEVFNPAIFFSSEWFANEISKLVHGEKTFVEVGCGTGIVSIKTVIENPEIEIYATDISPNAAELTKINATKNNVAGRIHVYSGDVFERLSPEIRADSIFWAMPFGYLEPEEVLEGKDTQTFDPGYRAIKKFFTDSRNHLKEKGRLLIGFSTDIGHFELLEQIATKNGFNLKLLKQTKGMEKDSVSMEIYQALPTDILGSNVIH
jgi:release factor glutamine methyltransferase